MTLDDYLLPSAGLDMGRILSCWAPLIPDGATVWLANQFGEPFLVSEDGSVHHFDPEGGAVEQVAESRDDFISLLGQEDNANQWFLIPLVEEARAAGMTLGPGQCYGFAQPTVLGGDYALSNVRVKTMDEYFAFLADLHAQIRDVPDGAQVEIEWTD